MPQDTPGRRLEMMYDIGDGYVAINWDVVQKNVRWPTDEWSQNIARMMLAIRDKTWIHLPKRIM